MVFDGSVPSAGGLEKIGKRQLRTKRSERRRSLHMRGVGIVNDTNDRSLVYTESQRDTDVRKSMNL